MWETALAILATVFGVSVTISNTIAIRQMERSKPVLASVDRFIAAVEASRKAAARGTPDLTDIRVLAFDPLDTLMWIADPRNPWGSITEGASHAAEPSLTASLEAYAATSGVPWDPRWAMDLAAELQSITVYDETRAVLPALREAGYRIAVLTNLPRPYRDPIHRLIGTSLDAEIFAYQVRTAAPRPRIYAALCAQLDVMPSEILVISHNAAVSEGARLFGMSVPEFHCDPEAGGQAELPDLAELARLLRSK